MRELSTTSYALLALLGVQPFTAYELAQQMERSLADFWPRAQSVLYNEAKNLTAHGLATSERVHTGQRASTRYTITDQGRVALQQWLDTPASGPQLQFEALVQVAFADHGSREQLVRTLDAIHKDAEANRARTEARGHEYVRDGGPFPDRLPIIALVAKLIIEHAALIARWAEWAEELVVTWPSLDASGGAEPPDDAFRVTWNTREPTR